MKLNGKKPNPNETYVVFPRDEGDIVFKAKSVLDTDPFESLYPPPKPPRIQRRGEDWADNVEDPDYKKSIQLRAARKFFWVMLQSIRDTEGLEWEIVQYDDPETWEKMPVELKEFMSEYEVQHLFNKVLEVNSLSDDKLDEARDRFLATRQRLAAS